MKLTLNDADGRNIIRSYDAGCITINDGEYFQSLILTPDQIIPDWTPKTTSELTREHLEQVAACGAELVLLGTGKRQQFPPAEIIEPLIRQGIGLEIMDTHAACRTYNILVGEDRQVAAALIIE